MALIAPSILAADFGRLAEEAHAVELAGADLIHVDVMDGHFVPNLTLGPNLVAALDKATELPLDVHLMVEKPLDFVEAFVRAGADWITVHCEVVDDVEAALSAIESHGCRASLAINPATPVEAVSPWIERAAMILIMSVVPGFGGQSFMENSLPKLQTLRDLKEKTGSECLLEVDGGVKADNISRVVEAGVDVVVSGSGIFGAADYSETIAAMHAA
ncbi:MAG: ribulose-phosphate 3-epimerase [Deltaproteobacteria bacterium]|nr:ribulose-phosphate 3-epimerase [Deltaproteobacteria bacterium]